jgi:hypothetical protein
MVSLAVQTRDGLKRKKKNKFVDWRKEEGKGERSGTLEFWSSTTKKKKIIIENGTRNEKLSVNTEKQLEL